MESARNAAARTRGEESAKAIRIAPKWAGEGSNWNRRNNSKRTPTESSRMSLYPSATALGVFE